MPPWRPAGPVLKSERIIKIMPTAARSLLYAFCLLMQSATAQLLFSSLPSDLQMMPRDRSNLGHFTVSGSTTDTSIHAIHILLRRNSDAFLQDDRVLPLKDGNFSTDLSIPALLDDYTLEVYSLGRNKKETLEKTVKQLVAGDFFIVSGQSNATGALWPPESVQEDSLYSNYYCRTIGSIFQWASSYLSLEQDCIFLRPSSFYQGTDKTGCIGIWPLRIMHHVVKATGVPLCIINGAMGGTTLSYHLATHTPSDPGKLRAGQDSTTPSSYDRMFKKLFVNNAVKGVKAIFWYQGESDGALSREEAAGYTERFRALYTSWKLDYPMLEKIFVFQINTGCGGDHLGLIREQERRFPELFPEVIVMPTVGSLPEERAPDGCHYTSAGCQKLGENMAPAVLKHLCHKDLDEAGIMGPNIQRVYYLNSRQICLEFDREVTVQQSLYLSSPKEGTVFIKDYFYKKNKAPFPLKRVWAEGRFVYLEPADTLVEITRLTYLPEIFSNLPSLYTGPWILNKHNENLGALSFFEFPVESFRESQADPLIYPNPVHDFLMIRSTDNVVLNKFSLHDVSGKLVRQAHVNGENLIDMRDLEDGLYFLTCPSTTGTITRRIILKK